MRAERSKKRRFQSRAVVSAAINVKGEDRAYGEEYNRCYKYYHYYPKGLLRHGEDGRKTDFADFCSRKVLKMHRGE